MPPEPNLKINIFRSVNMAVNKALLAQVRSATQRKRTPKLPRRLRNCVIKEAIRSWNAMYSEDRMNGTFIQPACFSTVWSCLSPQFFDVLNQSGHLFTVLRTMHLVGPLANDEMTTIMSLNSHIKTGYNRLSPAFTFTTFIIYKNSRDSLTKRFLWRSSGKGQISVFNVLDGVQCHIMSNYCSWLTDPAQQLQSKLRVPC